MVLDVLTTWTRIKRDSRIDSITSTSFTTSKERKFKGWGLQLLSSSSSTFARDFMMEHTKHEILHHNNTKTVFIAEDAKTHKHYIIKEILITSPLHQLPVTNEYDILRRIFPRDNMTPEQIARTGIAAVPDIYFELVRVSLVYPLYPMDLFGCINYNTDKFQTDGFSEEIIKIFLAQFLEALKTLKDSNVVHRDIKPENVCLQENGNLVLTDFELAIVVPSNHHDISSVATPTTPNVLVGTSLYIAPETFRTLEYSYQTDLWAVAILACELHSSNYPWNLNEHMSPEEVGRTILSTTPVKPPGMSNALWGFLKKILVNKDIRINVEEAMEDPLFSSYTFSTMEEGSVVQGNVFDTHPCLVPVSEICQERGHVTNVVNAPLREKQLEAKAKTQSPLISGDRRLYVESLNPKGVEQRSLED
mmetsp:Transcript_19674/g.40845  ORF Transcript_19674/g.40845 Transcript_19674/m.40845 type:complete len:419 (+) Transcript_19674:500-1756(+)